MDHTNARRWSFFLVGLSLVLLLVPMSTSGTLARQPRDQEAFTLREKIEFSIRWSFVPLIKSCLQTHRLDNANGSRLYRLTHESTTNAFWNDRMASIIDSDSLLPYRTETVVRKGKKRFVESIVFARTIGKALFSHRDPGTGQGVVDSFDITKTSMDPLSAFYYLRKRLSPGRRALELEGTTGEYHFMLQGTLRGEEPVDVPAGSFRAYRVECRFTYRPYDAVASPDEAQVEEGGEGAFTLWLSQDDHRFPIQIRYHLPLGSLWVKAVSLTSNELDS